MDPTNKPLTIELEGRTMDLYFDFWTIQKFEVETKKNYMNWIAGIAKRSQLTAFELQMMETTDEATRDVDKMRFAEIIGDVMGFGDFVSIIWAAHHTPGKNPRWLSTIESLAPICDQEAFYRWALPIMQAACKSVQRRKKPDEPVTEERPTSPSPMMTPNGGGTISGDLDDGILDSLTKKSAN